MKVDPMTVILLPNHISEIAFNVVYGNFKDILAFIRYAKLILIL
jgi:hypothetical protein